MKSAMRERLPNKLFKKNSKQIIALVIVETVSEIVL